MIYEQVLESDPIKSGDIFENLPFIQVNLSSMSVLEQDGKVTPSSWDDIKDEEKIPPLVYATEKVWGIVMSQDCENTRAPTISFFRIGSAYEITGSEYKDTTKFHKWLKNANTSKNGKWYYLPIDESVGFNERKGVNFEVVFQVDRVSLEQHKELRRCRLKKEALEHYQESIGQFYRRYAYNEWYPLTPSEFDEYWEARDKNPTIKRYPWQDLPTKSVK